MPILKVFEYSHLVVNDLFTESHFFELVKYNEFHGNKYFTIGNKRIYFKNYVGVVQVGNLTIEILPKADLTETPNTTNKWHNALMQMLHISGYLNIDSISNADLQSQGLTIIDLLYRVFLKEVESLAHHGLIRKYRSKDENRNFLKGRLLFHKHIAENRLHKEKFYTKAQVYDHDNIYNQILLIALKLLKSKGEKKTYYPELNNLITFFDSVSVKKITESTFENISYSRNTLKYKKAINLAKLIIQNLYPDTKTGTNQVFGLLFDMNLLYESVVYKLLKKQEDLFENYQLKLFAQTSKKFWSNRSIRPDILGEYYSDKLGKTKKFIIDTKWKRPKDGIPSDEDLKQMFAYNVHFGSNASNLLYPDCDNRKSFSSSYHFSKFINSEGQNHICSTFYIQMFDDDGKIRKDAGRELLQSILGDEYAFAT